MKPKGLVTWLDPSKTSAAHKIRPRKLFVYCKFANDACPVTRQMKLLQVLYRVPVLRGSHIHSNSAEFPMFLAVVFS
jgi:hypothetical protein